MFVLQAWLTLLPNLPAAHLVFQLNLPVPSSSQLAGATRSATSNPILGLRLLHPHCVISQAQVCKCPKCLDLYKETGTAFLIDETDTVHHYEDQVSNNDYIIMIIL